MNKQIYEQLIEGRDGIILDENSLVQNIVGIYWDEVYSKPKKQKHQKLLNMQFYNNCLEALKFQKMTGYDLIKYEVLSTIIKAINNIQDADLASLKITRDELETVKFDAKELIEELKRKYEKKLKTNYEETFKAYWKSVQSKIIKDICNILSDQLKVKLNENEFFCIEDLISIAVGSGNYNMLINLCAPKDNIEEVKTIINEIFENATKKKFEELDEEEKTILSMANFTNTNVDEKLTEIIIEDLKFEKLRKHCKNKDEMKIVDCIIELKEKIVKNIKDTAIEMRSGDALFITGYTGIDFDLFDFMQITEEKIDERMEPEDILAEAQAINGKPDFKGIVYSKDDAILAILRKYIDNNGYCDDGEDYFDDKEYYNDEKYYNDNAVDYPEFMGDRFNDDDPVGYTGQPAIRRRRR